MSIVKDQLHKQSTRALSSLYLYTSNLAEEHAGNHKGVAAGTAATLISMGMDRMDPRASLPLADDVPLTEEEIEVIGAAEKERHFMDRFLDGLTKHTLPDSAETKVLQHRINDSSRAKTPPLSLRVLASNLRRLSVRLGPLLKAQLGAVKILTWKRPSLTLCALCVYTAVCLWPHLVLAFPLLFVLFGLVVPAYLHRHPMQRPLLIKVRRRGQLLWQFLNESDGKSLLFDYLEPLSDDELLSSRLSNYGYPLRLRRGSVDEKEEGTKLVKLQVLLLMNLRDFQNLTTDALNGLDRGEDMCTDIVGFKDEHLTTYLFYCLLAATWVVIFLGQFIPWRLIFIQSGWVTVLLGHPHTKTLLKNAGALAKKRKRTSEPKPPTKLEPFESANIIVDDKPEKRTVEIFELEMRNVLKHEWAPYAYTKRFFDARDTVRASGKKPHGVDNLAKVMPPKEWKFDFGFANNWRIDLEPQAFLSARGIDQTHIVVKEDGWIYDTVDTDSETAVQFRRRRLYRECYRYARPVLKFAAK